MNAVAITQSIIPSFHDQTVEAYLLRVDAQRSSALALPATGSLTVGRGEEAEIRIEDTSVSRRHARFTVSQGDVSLTDLGSHNGTQVNGERLSGGCRLGKGDVVSIGPVHLILHQKEPTYSSIHVDRFQMGERLVIVADPAMRQLYQLIHRLAASELSVMIGGETGVGKEHAAWALHHGSRRAAGPFVTLNCAGLQDTLLESELFGHEKGAFTGAAQTKPGLLEMANGGTVFLDEVGELSSSAQAKLLRVLETRRLMRVGSTSERPVDIRIVAATHRDLEADVTEGRFRKDLFFRLSGATVALPPLRDRPHELLLLTEHFIELAFAQLNRPVPIMSAALQDALASYEWPGNVRELKNTADYLAAATHGNLLTPSDLPERIQRGLTAALATPMNASPDTLAGGSSTGLSLSEEVEALEKHRYLQALEACEWVQTRAARKLGVPLRTFTARVKRLGLKPPDV